MGFGSGANEEWARAKEIYSLLIPTMFKTTKTMIITNKKAKKQLCLNFNLKQNCQKD